MKFKIINIHNYRSIKDISMICESFVVLLGPNNHGKSNILSAIEFFLSSSSKPNLNDFCIYRDDESLWVEVVFHELTEQEKITFNKYLRADSSICIRKTARTSETGNIEIIYNGYIQEPEDDWLKESNASEFTNRDIICETPLAPFVPPSGRLTAAIVKETQSKYINEHKSEINFIENLEGGPLLGAKNVGAGILPDFYLIPAIRDLADETKIKNTTVFGKLLNRAVKEMAERDPRFTEIKSGLEELVKSLKNTSDADEKQKNQLIELEQNLNTELNHWDVKVEIEILPPVIEKIFELGTSLQLDDGVKTLAEQKGHGLQRAVIFALVKAWANVLRATKLEKNGTVPRASSESLVFGMEEPELFLHPHAQRRLFEAIQQISDIPGHQVFICSHSSHFVDLNKYRSVIIVGKENSKTGTKVRQCLEDLFKDEGLDNRKKRFHMAHWINPDRGEMFFAKKIIFVEGETEKTILPYLANKLNCYEQDISIIECGSKFNFPLYMAIANAFKIPYLVIHDEDPMPVPVPECWSEEKRISKLRTFNFNQDILNSVDQNIGHILVLKPEFEAVAGISKSQGEKKGKALAAIEHFEDKIVEEISTELASLIKNAFQGD